MLTMNPIRQAFEDLKQGKMIILMDDEDRENEGDLVMAAEFATRESINFMMKEGRGLICVPLEQEKAEKLNLSPMLNRNTDPKGTAFTVSIDHISAKTGISAGERACTIKELTKENITDRAFTRPGHIFPLIAKDKGVLERPGHTEAAVDLMKLAGLEPVGVICEIAKDDGEMARRPDLEIFAKKHGLGMYTIKDLIDYRKKHDLIEFSGEAMLPTKFGDFKMRGYENKVSGKEHFALVKGDVKDGKDILVRVHSECMTGDVLGSLRCDCGNQLQHAMEQIEEAKAGIVIYLRQEGRGIGLLNKIKAYSLQDQGADTVDANLALGFDEDEREYVEAVAILKELGVKSVKLMTNNPLKVEGLESWGIDVSKRVDIIVGHCKTNEFYMETKKVRMGHLI